jgi:hypothetical protein
MGARATGGAADGRRHEPFHWFSPRRGDSFEYVVGYVRVTWLPDMGVIILNVKDEYRGSVSLRRRLRGRR